MNGVQGVAGQGERVGKAPGTFKLRPVLNKGIPRHPVETLTGVSTNPGRTQKLEDEISQISRKPVILALVDVRHRSGQQDR